MDKENPKLKASTGEVFYKGELLGEMIIQGDICWSNVDFDKHNLIGCKIDLIDESELSMDLL